MRKFGDVPAQEAAYRHKANVDAGEKNRQAQYGIKDTHEYFDQSGAREAQPKNLKQNKDGHDRQQHFNDFFERIHKLYGVQQRNLRKTVQLCRRFKRKAGRGSVVKNAHDEHSQNRADRTERAQAEAVFFAVFSGKNGGNTHAERQYERYGDGAGGHTAGIKGHRQKIGGENSRHQKNQRVRDDKQVRQVDLEHDAQQRQHQKEPRAKRDGSHQNLIGHGRHLFCQYLQIRLCDRDDHADQESASRDPADLFGARQL